MAFLVPDQVGGPAWATLWLSWVHSPPPVRGQREEIKSRKDKLQTSLFVLTRRLFGMPSFWEKNFPFEVPHHHQNEPFPPVWDTSSVRIFFFFFNEHNFHRKLHKTSRGLGRGLGFSPYSAGLPSATARARMSQCPGWLGGQLQSRPGRQAGCLCFPLCLQSKETAWGESSRGGDTSLQGIFPE